MVRKTEVDEVSKQSNADVSSAELGGRDARATLFIPIIVLLLSYASFELINPWNTHLPIFMGLYLFTFSIYGLTAFLLFRGKFDAISSPAWILIPALLFRLIVFWSPPSLSEDFYRYLWDGRVQNAGIGPYDSPPQGKELAFLRDENYERINHKDFKTPYPAAAETIFHVFAGITTQPVVFKAFIAIFDIGLLGILRRLLLAEKRNAAWLLLYAWHPLPILEFSGSGHMDIMGICLLFAAYLLLRGKRFFLSGIAFACAVLIKYLPAATIPWFWKQGKWKFLISAVTVGSLFVYQYYTPDLKMFAGVMAFYKKWWFNDSLFGILRNLLHGAEPARVAGMCFALIALGFSYGANFSFYRSAFVVFGTVILFSPVVHPWYLCWVLPFLIFHPNKAWLFLSGWIVLAYWIRYLFPSGVWQPVLWLKLLIYVPFYVFLIAEIAISRWRRRVIPLDEMVSSDIA